MATVIRGFMVVEQLGLKRSGMVAAAQAKRASGGEMSNQEGDLRRPAGADGTFTVAAIQATPSPETRLKDEPSCTPFGPR